MATQNLGQVRIPVILRTAAQGLDSTPGIALDQKQRVGDSPNFTWYRWDGTNWIQQVDSGSEIYVESIQIEPDATPISKAANTLGIDPTGKLVIYDNDRAGGVRVSDDRRFRGLVSLDSAATATFIFNDFIIIPLTAVECAAGNTFEVFGSLRVYQAGATMMDFGVGLQTQDAHDTAAGFPDASFDGSLAWDSTQKFTTSHLRLIYKNTAGSFKFDNGAEWRQIFTTSASSGMALASPVAVGSSMPAEAQNLYISLQSLGGADGAFFLEYDLTLIVTKA